MYVIVAGGEEKGLHELIKNKCDFLVRIPAPGKPTNTSFAVSISTTVGLMAD